MKKYYSRKCFLVGPIFIGLTWRKSF
jgi:hypothetical protein